MPSLAQVAVSPPKRVALPRTSTRLQAPQSYVKVITGMKTEAWGATGFEGKIYSPGQVVDLDALPRPAVAIECAGPIGIYQRGKHRETLYILWRFDVDRGEWVEIA